MKSLLLTLFSLLLTTPALAQGFVEEFRSEPGFRPPVLEWKHEVGARDIIDLNGNGAPDLPMRVEDENGDDELRVIDGALREPLFTWVAYETWPKQIVGFEGFYDLRGDGSAMGLLTLGEAAPVLVVVDVASGLIVWSLEDARLFGVADVDEDDRPELLLGDRPNRQVVVVGWEDGGTTHAPPTSAAWTASAAGGYDIALKFESAPNRELAYDTAAGTGRDAFDANGDGVPEIVMVRDDDAGEATGLIVRNGAAGDEQWRFDYPDGAVRDDLAKGFRGFFDVNGDGQREALFGDRTAVTLDRAVHTLDADFELLTVFDVDGDGYGDLIGRSLANRTVQVWGRATPTSIDADDLAAAGFVLHPNYPNPFNPVTTIRYDVPEVSHVTLVVYDALGRQVQTLVDGQRVPGQHEAVFEATGLPSGVYVVRAQVGPNQASRVMLLLK